MKLNNIKNFIQKSYICNIKNNRHLLSVIALILVIPMLLTGCNSSSPAEIPSGGENTAEAKEETKVVEKAKNRSLEIVSLYKDKYINAEKMTSEYYYNQTVISQEVVDEIENLLRDKGYPVMNSDSKYPTYLENAESVYDFWESVSANKNAEQELMTVSVTGEMYYTSLHYTDGKKYRTYIVVGWDENNEPVVTSDSYIEIMDWELINDKEFYYQVVYPPRVPFDDYALVRLAPMDKTLYDLTEKYIAPIGYLSNNMFVCEWDSNNYGDLSFNDLLEYFYRVKNNELFNMEDYESVREPYYCTYIPKALFENTVKPYFDISLEEFRKLSLYDSGKGVYPWQEVCCENARIYPSVEPEVVKYKENNDGTFTLTINVRCNDYKTDRLFTHEVVIRPLNDGGYQYLSNKITYKSEHELPPNYPRLPPQREKITEE